MLEFRLPFCVGAEGMSGMGLSLGLNGKHFCSVIKDGSSGVAFRARPFCIGERTERRRFLSNADVARNEVGLFEGDVKFGFIGEFQREDFGTGGGVVWRAELRDAADSRSSPLQCERGSALLATRHFDDAEEFSDAMFEMDHEIPFIELAEIDGRAIAALGSTQTSPAMSGKSAKQFVRG